MVQDIDGKKWIISINAARRERKKLLCEVFSGLKRNSFQSKKD